MRGGVAGGELEVGGGEEAHGVDLADGLGIVGIAIELAGAQFHVCHQHTGADRRFLA